MLIGIDNLAIGLPFLPQGLSITIQILTQSLIYQLRILNKV